ncbi:MAG TPA: NifU family protein [Spirochaetales bacterium]|nr:NifU family protein [Spirochaetales bacterium]
MKEKVQAAIDDVRPSLQMDGGDIELVDVDETGKVKVKLTGACHGCPMAQLTLKQGVEKYLKKTVPEISTVESV